MTSTITPTDRVLNAKQVAELLGTTHGTIRQWDTSGKGPKSFKMNGLRRWRESTVNAWLAEKEAAANGPDAA